MKKNAIHTLFGSKTGNRIIVSFVCAIAIALALIPWSSEYLQNRALTQAELGLHEDALKTAEYAARLNPLSVDAQFVLAGAQQRLGRVEEARQTLLESTRLQPGNHLVWEQLAVYERDRWGQPELAVEHFQKALSLNPRDRQLRERAGLPPLEE